MLNASCVHTRISWPTSHVEKHVIGESLMPPLAVMTFIDAIMHLYQVRFYKNAWQKGHLERAIFSKQACLTISFGLSAFLVVGRYCESINQQVAFGLLVGSGYILPSRKHVC